MKLWREIPCSTHSIENANSSGSCLLKQHETYELETLSARNEIHQCRASTAKCQAQKAIDRLRRKVAALGNKKPSRAGGRHMFFRDQVKREQLARGRCNKQPSIARINVMKQHTKDYNKLHKTQQVAYDEAASEWVAKRHGVIERKVAAIDLAIDELMPKLPKEEDDHNNHRTSVRFRSEDLDVMASMMDEPKYNGEALKEWWYKNTRAADVPSVEVQEALIDAAEERFREKKHDPPWWARYVCFNRTLFEDCAIALDPHPQEAYYLLHKPGNPYTCEMSVLTVKHDEPRAFEIAPEARSEFYQEFDYLPFKCLCEDQVPISEFDDVYVFEGIRLSHGVARTSHAPVRFEEFVATHPPLGRRPSSKQTRPQPVLSKDAIAELLKANPWLSREDLGLPPEGRKRKRQIKTRGKGLKDPDPHTDGETDDNETEDELPEWKPVDVPVHEVKKVDVKEIVAEHRALHRVDVEDETYFYIHHFGGVWTAEHVGKAIDRVGCKARAGVARAWCLGHAWPRQKSYSYSKYDVAPANMLAREVARKANYFFRMWLEAEHDLEYTDEMLASYEETFEWVDWLCGQDVEGPAFEAGIKIRHMFPSSADDSIEEISEDEDIVEDA